MAAAAPAAPAPTDPRQQWIDFNLDLWRPNRHPARTEPGQPGVRKGALNAWNKLSATARNTVTTELGIRVRQLAHGAMAPLPHTAGNYPTVNAVVNYFNRLNNGLRAERQLLRAMNNLHDVLPEVAAKTRILNYRDQIQANVDLREQNMGLVQAMMRRSNRLQAAIGGIAPAGATPTYAAVNAYLLGNLNLLRARVRDRQTFGTDLDGAITITAGAADIVRIRRRIYFQHLRTQNTARMVLERAIIGEIERWNNFGIDLDQTQRTIGNEPDMNNLEQFIRHLDALKALEASITESNDFRNIRQSGHAVSARSEVQDLYQWVDRLANLHTNWLARVTPDRLRLQDLFHTSKWWDSEGLTGDEKELLDEIVEIALLDRESLEADLSGSWIGPFFLGAGGHGRASTWIKQDSTGHIVDRVVVKDSANQNPNQLSETGVWQPPNGWPMEAAAMYKLVDLPGSDSIVNIRNWKTKLPWAWGEEQRLNYRIYMEYCRGGNVRTLWMNYYPRAPGNTHMPEPFIWAVLDSLVTAGQLMEGGHLRKEAQPLWDQIIHGDMKDDNVFLGENTSETFRGYPLQAKLGDFGLATIFPARGISPPDDWVEFSGARYRAPELARIWPTGNPGATMPDSKANVWGVGMILRMLLKQHALHGVWRDINEGQPRQPRDFNGGEYIRYSQPLRDLIMSCLRPNPQHRPTFTMLRQEVLNQNQHSTNADLRGLRDAPVDDERFERLGPPRTVDTYALGLAVRDLEYNGIPQRVPSPPAADSPVVHHVAGMQGALVTGAEDAANAEQAFRVSVMGLKRTFEAMQAG